MALTHEEITEIENEIIEKCKTMFVQINDCNNKQTEVNRKFANDDKRIDRILLLQESNTKALQKNNWLTTAILSVIIGIVVTMILKTIGVF
jgi:hypothetical protein